jgi:oxygen-independent coproporphyrinogen-3 oxidase
MNTDAVRSESPDCSVYIHVPFCVRKCRYCAFYSVAAGAEVQQEYLRAVKREWAMYKTTPPLSTIFIGGGSPSAMERTLLYDLIEWIGQYRQPNTEFTLEVNPGQTDSSFFTELYRRGVNRISIGAQSFLDKELSFLGRIHTAAEIGRCITDARNAEFENIGLDLIFALPDSTLSDWTESLEKAITLNPKHLSAYSLTYEGDTPLVRGVQAGHIVPVDEELDRAMYEHTIDTFEAAGFAQYEISNFAQPGWECKHNLRYWQNQPYIGLGPAAASCYQGKRMENIADLGAYLQSIHNNSFAYESEHILSPQEIACETAVLNLRTRTGIDPVAFERQTGFDFQQLFADAISEHLAQGNLEWHNGRLRLTREALAIADKVMCDFASI